MKKQIDTLIMEIMIKERLRSPRQVFERYPHLGTLWEKNKLAS